MKMGTLGPRDPRGLHVDPPYGPCRPHVGSTWGSRGPWTSDPIHSLDALKARQLLEVGHMFELLGA